MNGELNSELSDLRSRSDTVFLWAIAGAVALLHLLTNSRYGFHRDELQVLAMLCILTGDSFRILP